MVKIWYKQMNKLWNRKGKKIWYRQVNYYKKYRVPEYPKKVIATNFHNTSIVVKVVNLFLQENKELSMDL